MSLFISVVVSYYDATTLCSSCLHAPCVAASSQSCTTPQAASATGTDCLQTKQPTLSQLPHSNASAALAGRPAQAWASRQQRGQLLMLELQAQTEVAWSQSLAAQPFEPSLGTRMPAGHRCFDPQMATASWDVRRHLPRSRWVRGSGVAWSRGCKVGMAHVYVGQAATSTLLPAYIPGKARG